jgi:hypothetical protein
MTEGPDHFLVLSTQFPAVCFQFFCCGQGFLCPILEFIKLILFEFSTFSLAPSGIHIPPFLLLVVAIFLYRLWILQLAVDVVLREG